MKKHLSLLACLILVIVVTLSCLISKDNTNNLITDSKGTLAVYLDGEPADGLPGLDTKYRFESIECENGGTASFDWINEKLNVEKYFNAGVMLLNTKKIKKDFYKKFFV